MSDVVDGSPQSAIARGLRVLEYLARQGAPTRLTDVAAAVGLQKSTTHRTLSALVKAGYVDHVKGSGGYAATLKLWELGTNTLHTHAIQRAAGGVLPELHRATGETVSLTILVGDDVLYLDKILSPRKAKFATRVGSRIPAPLTASGKAMLAHLRDARARINRVAAQLKDSDAIDVDALMHELAQARARGYAHLDCAHGVLSIAAPVMTRSRLPAGALTVSAPVDRITPQARNAMIERVLYASARVSERVSN
jgi:IclR family acetate operon transcriptional repressor